VRWVSGGKGLITKFHCHNYKDFFANKRHTYPPSKSACLCKVESGGYLIGKWAKQTYGHVPNLIFACGAPEVLKGDLKAKERSSANNTFS
jgi:hypothetical protein